MKPLTHGTTDGGGGNTVVVVDRLNRTIFEGLKRREGGGGEDFSNKEEQLERENSEKKPRAIDRDCVNRLQSGGRDPARAGSQEGRGLGKLLILSWSYSVKNLSKHEESTAKPPVCRSLEVPVHISEPPYLTPPPVPTESLFRVGSIINGTKWIAAQKPLQTSKGWGCGGVVKQLKGVLLPWVPLFGEAFETSRQWDWA